MKYTLPFLIISTFFVSIATVYAAAVHIDAPHTVTGNAPIKVTITLDPEQGSLSSVAGTLSFPSDAFDISEIKTQNSVVSLWVTRPHVSEEKYADARTRITFEGLMPGGFSGVRSPYYVGTKPGIIFTALLTPKSNQELALLLDDLEAHAYDAQATEVPLVSVHVPMQLSGVQQHTIKPAEAKNITSSTLTPIITRNENVNNNAWYLLVSEDESLHPVSHIEVAESSYRNPEDVRSYEWKNLSVPYVLSYQSRVKYIHVKATYENNTFAYATLHPVENLPALHHLSFILSCIAVALCVLFYVNRKRSNLKNK